MANYIYLDIETIPCDLNSEAYKILQERHNKSLENIKAPSNYGKEASEKFIDKKRAEAVAEFDDKWKRTALDGALGQVLCIGYAINDESAKVIHQDTERKSLIQFVDAVKSYFGYGKAECMFVGHNILDFDLRFLYQRGVVNSLTDVYQANEVLKPQYKWNEVHDTMKMFCGYKNRISQDHLARLLGLEGKKDMDGSKVFDEWEAGNIMKIMNYCKDDVNQVRDIHKKLT